VLTGKGLQFGGSLVRTEATGYGCVYFCENMLKYRNDSFKNKRVSISGSGNVAIYAAEKATELGATVVTLSDSSGYIYDPDGIDADKLAFVKVLKEVRRGRISEYVDEYAKAEYFEGRRPWVVPADIALPCATQNEIEISDAKDLVKNGVQIVAEGANMPTDIASTHYFHQHDVLFGPGKASNAGGVAVSGLEQSQNALRLSWTKEEVDQRLQIIMHQIHEKCVHYGTERGTEKVNYVRGANLGGFLKVAEAMLAYGVV
jgi:glutamate dehydrogenase (NADP+)